MKTNKIFIILTLLFLIIVLSFWALSINNKKNNANLKKYNYEYEKYLNKTITGTELATLMNKAINQNEINKIKQDKQKHYIENDKDSIKIEIKITLTGKTYPMEEFYNNDTNEFVKYFSEIQFHCVDVEYHKKTGKVGKLKFEQISQN